MHNVISYACHLLNDLYFDVYILVSYISLSLKSSRGSSFGT